jgi:hypothetical protein
LQIDKQGQSHDEEKHARQREFYLFSVPHLSINKAQAQRAHHFLTYNTPAKADRDFWQTSMSGAALTRASLLAGRYPGG